MTLLPVRTGNGAPARFAGGTARSRCLLAEVAAALKPLSGLAAPLVLQVLNGDLSGEQ